MITAIEGRYLQKLPSDSSASATNTSPRPHARHPVPLPRCLDGAADGVAGIGQLPGSGMDEDVG
ncbi:hypothetical protein BBJK_02353 [Bifidobacterium bifidum LMG 13195]|uniref:Uncharacterized protein n=1 Tax=Bifidobacterium bifidum LMG 13195 TaxID=1207542 RepID=A0A286TED9_BIFBI|nr:hypothetical protein BBJK_02353 [Bifidobacterium bifidum LMG 13195]